MKKKRNVHAQREKFAFGTQRNLYSTDLRWGFALGITQLLSLALGLRQIFAFSDTNMLVYPMQNSRVGAVTQRQTPARRVLLLGPLIPKR